MQNLNPNIMYKALVAKDPAYEGVFIVGVTTTGIFCRPTCRARKPKKENTEFFVDAKEALLRGYRPCKVCNPLAPKGQYPDWLVEIMKTVARAPVARMNDSEIRRHHVDPNRVRRWFKQNYNMTFQAYLRSLRLGRAFGHLAKGGKVIDAAFEHGYESLSGFTDAFKNLTGIKPSLSQQRDLIQAYQILTPLGPLLAATVNEGLCLLEFIDRRGLETELRDLQAKLKIPIVTSRNAVIEKLNAQLDEYFAGRRTQFEIPLVTPGTDFQNQVWGILRKIPHGETRSYKEQAVALGNPKAVRAVARANGQNRIAILIPCHRVIGSNGELVGYAGGIWRKKRLLELEANGS